MSIADMVEITIKDNDSVGIISADIVQMRNALELFAEKEASELEWSDVLDFVVDGVKAHSQVRRVREILREPGSYPFKIGAISSVINEE